SWTRCARTSPSSRPSSVTTASRTWRAGTSEPIPRPSPRSATSCAPYRTSSPGTSPRTWPTSRASSGRGSRSSTRPMRRRSRPPSSAPSPRRSGQTSASRSSRPALALIRPLAGGDREALAAFYDLYAPLAFGLLRRMLRDVEEAAEVLQEVFWELWRAAGEYDPRRGSPEAWVTVRARSRGIDRVRSVRRREEMLVAPLNETAAAVPEAMANPGALVEEREMVRGFLRELPAEQREAIALAYLQGMTQSQISAHLGLPLGTVKTRMRLGLERLRGMAGSRT